MRTLIYARFSSQHQNSKSIEDQIAVCRERCEREGWTVEGIFTDYAISGAAGIEETQRPGINSLLARVEQGGIDQVLAESTDRIARHQGDSFGIREIIDAAGARLFTLSDGHIDEINGTFKGLMDSRFRKELAAKVKRGQKGTIAQGRSAAGLAYGYRSANRIEPDGRIVRGLRAIHDDQAEVVRRIFREYAAGESPRAIALGLNNDGIPGPRGGDWKMSTISGDRKRQNGILNNRLYIGELVLDRTSKVTDPRTRKTRIRVNVTSDWQRNQRDDLRIIDDETWERVVTRRESYTTHHFSAARRPKRLLSGLAFCSVCGSRFIVARAERWSCSNNVNGGSCTNNRSISTELLDGRVRHGLTHSLLDPDIVREAVTEFHLDYARRSAEITNMRGKLETRHAEASAKVGRLVRAIEEGGDEFPEIRAALTKARQERDRLAGELSQSDALPVIALHPGIADEYRRQVEQLDQLLDSDLDIVRREVVPVIRSMIDRVLISPNLAKQKGVLIEVQGYLANILALATGKPTSERMCVNSGAGSGNHVSTHILRTAV